MTNTYQAHTPLCIVASSRIFPLFVIDEKWNWKVSIKEGNRFEQPGINLHFHQVIVLSQQEVKRIFFKLPSPEELVLEEFLLLTEEPSIGRKSTNIAKEQKARFYIMRRCTCSHVSLLAQHKHGDS